MGLIHGDFNEFNLMIDDKEKITVIDLPQVCFKVFLCVYACECVFVCACVRACMRACFGVSVIK